MKHGEAIRDGRFCGDGLGYPFPLDTSSVDHRRIIGHARPRLGCRGLRVLPDEFFFAGGLVVAVG